MANQKSLIYLPVVASLLPAPLAQTNSQWRFMIRCAFALMFVSSSFLLAQSSDVERGKRNELVFAIKSVVAHEGLLGDITNKTPNGGLMLGSRFYLNNANLAVLLNGAFDTWGRHDFRGTLNGRTRVNRETATVGVLYFIGANPNPSNSYYLSIEGGIDTWHIDSNTYSLLGSNKQFKPISILKFGKGFQDMFFELGIEKNSLDVNKVDFREYKESNVALSVTFGFRDIGKKKVKKSM